MGFAKAVLAGCIEDGNASKVDLIELLKSKLPKPYEGRSVEARQWLLQEGFVEKIGSSKYDRVTKAAFKYIKAEGDAYFKTARALLSKDIDALETCNHSDQTNDNDHLTNVNEKSVESIGDNVNRKRSYGKNRTTQVKVNMSNEEVKLIDRLGELGYGNEGSRAATIRQAINDIFKIYNDLKISNINRLPEEIMDMKNTFDAGDARNENQILDSFSRDSQSEYIVIDEVKDLKKSIQHAFSCPNPTYVFCLASSDSGITMKLDALVEGISIVFDGKIVKVQNEYTLYKIIPGSG